MPGRPGRLGFKGVPGPLGEKGKSILPPDEWKFKVYLYSTETTAQPEPGILMHKKRKSHDNSEILFERERRGIKVRQAEKEKMYFFLLM